MVKRKSFNETSWEKTGRSSVDVHPGAPGSIEQQLDMCEQGELRGDQVEHRQTTLRFKDTGEEPREIDDDFIESNYSIDMSEANREGDEMSGDDHSFGLQGGEIEIEGQDHIFTGMPGDKGTHDDNIEKEENEEGRDRVA